MKKYIYCALLVLLCISCSKDDDLLMDAPFDAPETLYAQIPDFGSRAVREYQLESWDDTETVNSRTYAVVDPENASEYIQYWSPNDLISVFFTNKQQKYILTELKDKNENEESDYGLFQLVDGNTTGAKPLETDYYYAVYPYKNNTVINYKNGEITYNFPSTQHYSGDTYANGENGMIARELQNSDGKLNFQNFCSYLQLRLNDIKDKNNQSKTVQQITLAANNTNDKITGNAMIQYDENDAPVINNWKKTSAGNLITLDCGNGVQLGTTETKFWFVLPGNITFTEGFTVTVTFSDNSFIKKSTSKKIFIERSHIKPMAPLGSENDDEEDIEITGPIRYKYNDPSITDPYPLGGEFYGEDGKKLQVLNQEYDEETQEWVIYLSGKLKTIGGNNFQNQTLDIEYIKVNVETENSITISDFAFYNCTADRIIINNDVSTIGKSALKESYTNHLIINGDVSEIKAYAFDGCTNLQNVEAYSIETINNHAFYMCSNLTTFSISGLKYIGVSAFEKCTSLESIDLSSIIIIEDAAFWACNSLTRVDISENCIMIGEGAFCHASNLETVYCNALKPPFIKTDNEDGSFVFADTSENLCIYFRNGLYDDYMNSEYFINNTGYDSSIKATINWWFEEYYDVLNEMEN